MTELFPRKLSFHPLHLKIDFLTQLIFADFFFPLELFELIIDRDLGLVLFLSHFVLVGAVEFELDFLHGGVTAEEALERLLAQVDPHVAPEPHAGPEALATDLAIRGRRRRRRKYPNFSSNKILLQKGEERKSLR